MEPDDPPPKTYGFKERAFQRDNKNSASTPPMPTAQELAIMSGHGVPAKPPSLAGPKADDPNDVYAVLQQNRQVEQKDGADQIEIRTVKSRRRRDYWLLMVACNAGLLTVAALGRNNIIVLASALAGVIIVSLGLTWIMWQVMDDY